MTQCKKCIMSIDNDPDLFLSEHGICNHCYNYSAEAVLLPGNLTIAARQLSERLAEIKENGKGKKYDAILGVSGGVDSTYLAWMCKEWGLRVLLVHCDNGWNSELAVMNIQNVCNKTGFDLYTHVLDWESFKDLQLAFIKSSVVDIELPYDYALNILMYKVAKKFNVPSVLSGHNLVTEGTYMPKSWVHSKLDLTNVLDIHKKWGTKRLVNYPKMGILKYLYYQKTKTLVNYKLLNYVDYQKKEVKQFIIDKLEWRDYGYKHYESIFTRFYQGYILPRKFKIDKRQFHLSVLVQSGQMTREEALEEMELPIYPKEQFERDYDYVLKKFNLSPEAFESLMDAPIRQHTDYKNIKTFWRRYFAIIAMIKAPINMVKKILTPENKKLSVSHA
jgi:N-acetyl sugar amidotransferase